MIGLKIEGKTDNSCLLSETTCSSKTSFEIPVSKPDLMEAIVALLKAPEMRETTVGDAILTKNNTAIKVIAGHGSFSMPLTKIFALVIA